MGGQTVEDVMEMKLESCRQQFRLELAASEARQTKVLAAEREEREHAVAKLAKMLMAERDERSHAMARFDVDVKTARELQEFQTASACAGGAAASAKVLTSRFEEHLR